MYQQSRNSMPRQERVTMRCLTMSKGRSIIARDARRHCLDCFLKDAPGNQLGTCLTGDTSSRSPKDGILRATYEEECSRPDTFQTDLPCRRMSSPGLRESRRCRLPLEYRVHTEFASLEPPHFYTITEKW